MNAFEKLITILQNRKEKIATMESCTGGFLASDITDISGSSEVFEMGLVTYSNEMKIKFGVDEKVITTYTVYSEEVAVEMAKQVATLANASWGVGITGQLGREDPANPNSQINHVYYAIYHKTTNQIWKDEVQVAPSHIRFEQKQQAVSQIVSVLLSILQ